MNPSEANSYWWWRGQPSPASPPLPGFDTTAASQSGWFSVGHVPTGWLLAVASGLLLAAGWPPWPLILLMFVAFVPLLLAGEVAVTSRRPRQTRLYGLQWYLAMLLWNIGTTWWIWNSTGAGATAAILANAALQTLPGIFYFRIRRKYGVLAGLIALTLAWLGFEIFHLRWDLTWPWLTLGNAFAGSPMWVQWYSLTGHLGGTAWIWWVNAIVFLGFVKPIRKEMAKAVCWATAAVLLLFTVSLAMYPFAIEGGRETRGTEVVVVQPNIDPYTEKFADLPGFIPFEAQVARMWRLSDSLITPDTRWLLWPETALDATLDEATLPEDALIRTLRERLAARYPKVNLVVGMTTYQTFGNGATRPATSRPFKNGKGYYDLYNTAIMLSGVRPEVGIYHKSRLVPGVEGMPYPAVLGPLTGLVIDLGGSSGGLGSQPEREAFTDPVSHQSLGPVICYESIYGDFVTGYARQGAQFIGIITNDAWWGYTPGHVQHLQMASLRAIENRQWIARSANTGVSGFIDPTGRLRQSLPYGKQGALVGRISLARGGTLYQHIGDYGLLIFIAFWCLVVWRLRTKPEDAVTTSTENAAAAAAL